MPPVGFEPLDMPAGSQGYPPTTLHNPSSLGAPCLTSWTLQPDKHENAMPKSIHPNRTLAQDEIRTSRALQQRAANALQQRAHSKRFPSSGDAPCSWSGVWRDPSELRGQQNDNLGIRRKQYLETKCNVVCNDVVRGIHLPALNVPACLG